MIPVLSDIKALEHDESLNHFPHSDSEHKLSINDTTILISTYSNKNRDNGSGQKAKKTLFCNNVSMKSRILNGQRSFTQNTCANIII